MNLEFLRSEIAYSRRTGHRTLGVSIALHALLLLWLVHLRTGGPEDPGLAEIVLLEAGPSGGGGAPFAPAPAAPAPAAAQTVRGAFVEQKSEVRFRRESPLGESEPRPQSESAFADELNARLATLQRAASPARTGLAAIETPSPFVSPTGGSPAGRGTGGAGALALRRGSGSGSGDGTGSGLPLLLGRGPGGGGLGSGAGDLALAKLPAPERVTHAAAPAAGTGARQVLAGASLAGPIADRPVLESATPVYPEWAKQEAVEAVVTLYFVVLADGRVKDDVLVQKTAGFGDFDESACSALRAWRFAALAPGRTGEQWGTITFRFRLRDAR